MEQPGLVVAHRRLRCPEAEGPLADDVDEVLGAEDRAPQAQVGPDALLHAGDHDEAPLPAGRGLRRDQGDLRPGLAADEQCVTGHVLAEEVLEERVGSGSGQPVDEGPGGVEQGEHGIEVAVGPHPRRPAGERLPTPRFSDTRALPDRPEDRLGGDAGRPSPMRPEPCRRDAGGERRCDPGGRSPRPAEAPDPQRVAEQLGEQLVARPATTPAELFLPEQPAQSPQPNRVGPPDRREDEIGHPHRVDDVPRIAGHRDGSPRAVRAGGARRPRPGPASPRWRR